VSEPVALLRWSCDSCPAQATTEVISAGFLHKNAPDGWVRLGVLTKDQAPHGFRWLCGDCAGFIRRELPNALGLDTCSTDPTDGG